MDRSRYQDLYAAEAEDHVARLSRALLDLEGGDAAAAIEEAFRAAHTLKGMAATMGFSDVAARAHGLESLLESVRAGSGVPDPGRVDRLLELADDLEAAVRASLVDAIGGAPRSAAASHTEPGAARDLPDRGSDGSAATDSAATSAANETVVLVQLRRDTPLMAARAAVLHRRIEAIVPILGTEPDPASAAFTGEMRVRLAPGADLDGLRALLERDSDVARFHVARAAEAGGPLATPSTRVELSRLDELAESVAELALLHGRLRALVGDDAPLIDAAERASDQVGRLQDIVLALRMVPLREAFSRLPRIARDAARRLDKRVELQLVGDDVGLDRAIVDALADPLVHLLRNAVDHGIEEGAERVSAGKPETGRVIVSAERDRSRVTIHVRDDGRGVPLDRVRDRARAMGLLSDERTELGDDELLRILSRSGFSTAAQVSQLSGRGVGLDIVVERIRSLGGSVEMRSVVGRGTTFTMHLPLTLAVAQALRVRIGGEDYLIPVTHVVEVVEPVAEALIGAGPGQKLRLRDEALALVRMDELLDTPHRGCGAAAVIASVGSRRGALLVDELVGRSQITLQSFEPPRGMARLFTGATLLPDGRAALILDPARVL